jgi:hypothetical protein
LGEVVLPKGGRPLFRFPQLAHLYLANPLLKGFSSRSQLLLESSHMINYPRMVMRRLRTRRQDMVYGSGPMRFHLGITSPGSGSKLVLPDPQLWKPSSLLSGPSTSADSFIGFCLAVKGVFVVIIVWLIAQAMQPTVWECFIDLQPNIPWAEESARGSVVPEDRGLLRVEGEVQLGVREKLSLLVWRHDVRCRFSRSIRS